MARPKSTAHTNMATAMAIAGRASRACDGCGSQGARWYCEADNAYLCSRCDRSVHSANALASRHERVRLNPHGTVSQVPKKALVDTSGADGNDAHKPHHPRSTHTHFLPSRKRSRLCQRPNPHLQHAADISNPEHRRGKMKTESRNPGESHEVPNFITINIQESPLSFAHDSATGISMAEFCKGRATATAAMYVGVEDAYEELSSGDSGPDFLVPNGYTEDFDSAIGAPTEYHQNAGSPLDSGNGDEDSDNSHEMACVGDGLQLCGSDERYEGYPLEFSDIVGLGNGDAFEEDCENTSGFVDECCEVNGGGLGNGMECSLQAKMSLEQQKGFSFSKDFYYEVNQECIVPDSYDLIRKEVADVLRCSLEGEPMKHTPSLLQLNYEDVLSAWSDRCLWTDGKCPQKLPDDSYSEIAGDVGLVPDLSNGCQAVPGGGGDGGREARVMRYKEKRRTRLFSKKIRYEVRKLNAECRPRMKGRFVKRTPGCS
ncbi:zinc finger protein CONSTANS-LIKE 6 [Physcomitrium patens]|uniref:CCT domain-containing protein n=1 Tax=Physcomitrium patens TaxID=3218 RepID=A0A2K1K5S1_PHYPA|nr:zinc finger protein CONSTANS-LIKE 6-like [Physcomitrium patens]PNR49131.1 hypothetical protein PHYPA_011027 [Physcomitrium patens]|eukprot:XP_024382894.1 zinc finger protein CONSTANS-LIKE 6-like [Physcomitrella patens]